MKPTIQGVLLEGSVRVEGLGTCAADMPLWGASLGDTGAAALAAAGISCVTLPGDAVCLEDCLVLAPGTALLHQVPAAVVKRARQVEGDVVLRLGGALGAHLDMLAGGTQRSAIWVLQGRSELPISERMDAARSIELDPAERLIDFPFPGEALTLPMSPLLFMSVEHWVELLWANLFGLGPWFWDTLLHANPILAALRLAWGSVKALSVRPESVLAALSRRGPDVHVHPTAVVEMSVLGEGVRIGAGAVVRGSVLGAGAAVEELAICEGVVAARGAVVQRQGMLKFGVLGPRAQLGGVTQLSVLGRDSALKRGGYLMDQTLAGSALRYRRGEELVPAPLGLLGCCLGEGAKVGCGVSVAPGRVLAAGTILVARDGVVHPEVPQPGTYRVNAGGLEPT